MHQPAALAATRRSAASHAPAASHQPRLSAQHWHTSLSSSPQLRADLHAAGVDVAALQAYAERAHSKPAPLHLLSQFLDPSPTRSPPVVPAAAHAAPARGWNNAAHLDWNLLNGSREVSLGVGETAALRPDSDTGRRAAARLQSGLGGGPELDMRKTDRRSGHKLDYALPPQAERFTEDAYYLRIVDLRKAQEGKAPHMRMPAPVLWNGGVLESPPKDEQQRRVVEAHHRARQARADNLAARTQHGSSAEWTGAQRKLHSLGGCPAAGEDTAARCFHTDLPLDANGFRGNPRTVAQLAREQNLRDRSLHGRDHSVLSGARITTLPPSAEAQRRLQLSGPHAVGRARQDERRAELEAAHAAAQG